MNDLRKKAELMMRYGDSEIDEKRRKKAIIKRTVCSVSGFCAAAAIGFGIWNNRTAREAPDPEKFITAVEHPAVTTTDGSYPTTAVTTQAEEPIVTSPAETSEVCAVTNVTTKAVHHIVITAPTSKNTSSPQTTSRRTTPTAAQTSPITAAQTAPNTKTTGGTDTPEIGLTTHNGERPKTTAHLEIEPPTNCTPTEGPPHIPGEMPTEIPTEETTGIPNNTEPSWDELPIYQQFRICTMESTRNWEHEENNEKKYYVTEGEIFTDEENMEWKGWVILRTTETTSEGELIEHAIRARLFVCENDNIRIIQFPQYVSYYIYNYLTEEEKP